MNDDELHHLLRRNPACVPLASSFEREVWSRIEVESARTIGSLLREIIERTLLSFSRPLVATSMLATFALCGSVIGWKWHNYHIDVKAAVAYQQAINPLYHSGWEAAR